MIERYSRPRMKHVWSDRNKFDKWLRVEIAACEAWAEIGIVPQSALPAIRRAKVNLRRLNQILKETHHDVTAFTRSVTESMGDEARWIHFGMTSSDVWDTATSMQMVEAADLLLGDIDQLIIVLATMALKYKDTPMIGRTHGVHAEPTSFGLKLAIWVEEMRRNRRRLEQAREIIAVGKISGAVGTYATVDPRVETIACARLGLTPAPVSNQIIQRDRHAQFITTLAIIASSLEKFATEVRGLQRTETHEVEEPFEAGQTGSSAMPHKRNPELCERVCGLARLVRGYALTSMENVALWHERDISHSSAERVTLPDGCLVLDYALALFASVMKGLKVFPDRMKHNIDLTRGLVYSQRVLLALVEKGMTRTKAYGIVQKHAMDSWTNEWDFLALPKADPDVAAVMPPAELAKLFDYSYYLRHVDAVFQRLDLERAAAGRRRRAVRLAPKSV